MGIVNEIAKTANVGIDSVNALRSHVKNETLMHAMISYREDLQALKERAESELTLEEREDASVSGMEKTMLKGGIFVVTLTDKSNKNIAEMLIESASEGINDITAEKNRLSEAGLPVPKLADEMIGVFHANIGDLRNFL